MEPWLETFEKQGWVEWKNFLSEDEAWSIRNEIQDIQTKQGFRQAAIGKSNLQQVDTTQRGDFICWIDHTQAHFATQNYLNKMTHVMSELNRNFYLGVRDFECHYAHYPPGSFYKRHTDRHKIGSSRVVSTVLYLNPNWQENDGGELCIYPSDTSMHFIQPQLGTLALFLSNLEHEVKITTRDRMSITGWLLNEKIL